MEVEADESALQPVIDREREGGADVGITSSFLLPMIGSMTIITTFLSPYIIKLGWRITRSLSEKQAKKDAQADSEDSS